MRSIVVVFFALMILSSAIAQDADEFSKQPSKPIASLISVPFQNNFAVGAGARDAGLAYTLNIEPVIPQLFVSYSLGKDVRSC